MGRQACFFGLALAVSLAGCSTVSSTRMKQANIGSGVTYFLPTRDVKLSAERKLLKKDELDKAVAAKKTELDSIGKELTAANALVKSTQARLDQPAVQADAAAKQSVAKDLALAKADAANLTTKKTDTETELANLEASRLALAAAPASTCPFVYSAKLELLAPTADPEFRFVADATHNVFRDDETKLSINSDNLLTSANVVAADRTGDVIVEVAGALSGFGVNVGQQSLYENYSTQQPQSPELKCEQLPTKFAYRFDPADEGGREGVNKELVEASFPFQIQVTDLPAVAQPSADEEVGREGAAGALFYRSPLPVTVVIRQCSKTLTCGEGDSVPIDAALVMLPQVGPISFIPMRSSAFVRTVDDVVFTNGMITSWSATRPSEVLEVVRLPVKVLRAVVSVPAEIFRLRVDLSDREKGLASSQQAQIAAQTKLSVIRECVELARDDNEKALACFDSSE